MTSPYVKFTSGPNTTQVGPNLDLSTAVPGSLPSSILDSGAWTPTWTPVSGFSGVPAALSGQWQRVGNRIACSFLVTNVNTGVGQNLASLGLPVPRTVTTLQSVSGVAVVQATAQAGIVHGNSGVPGSAAVAFQALSAGVGDSVAGSFVYSLV